MNDIFMNEVLLNWLRVLIGAGATCLLICLIWGMLVAVQFYWGLHMSKKCREHEEDIAHIRPHQE